MLGGVWEPIASKVRRESADPPSACHLYPKADILTLVPIVGIPRLPIVAHRQSFSRDSRVLIVQWWGGPSALRACKADMAVHASETGFAFVQPWKAV